MPSWLACVLLDDEGLRQGLKSSKSENMAAESAIISTSDDEQPLAAKGRRAHHSIVKRLIDVTGAGLGLLFLSPFLLLVALMIRLESKGPALFCQRRTGYAGREFKIYKFRSMRVAEDGEVIRQAM